MDYLSADFQDLGSNYSIARSIKHALSNTNLEQCGFFKYTDSKTNYDFVACQNKNQLTEHFFSLDNKIFFDEYLKGNVISLFHSHTIDSPDPSPLDIEISNSLKIPSYIFSVSSKSSYLYYPESYCNKDLFDRIFIPIFQDCITFVKDYFKIKFDVSFSSNIKNWARPKNEANIALLGIFNSLFTEVSFNSIQHGDVIVFHPTEFEFFHVAVYIGDRRFAHHPAQMLPKIDLLSDEYLNKVYKIYRYKDL